MSRRVQVHTHDGPMHGWFGLSYANYLVLQRSLIQEMPLKWQERMVALLDELNAAFRIEEGVTTKFEVRIRDEQGRYRSDPLSQYRHPDHDLIESLRRK